MVARRNDGEGPTDVFERRRIGVAPFRILGGAAQVLDRVASVACALVVLGDEAEILARTIAAAKDQPVGNYAMVLLARLLQHALVGDLVQDVVLEDELARP